MTDTPWPCGCYIYYDSHGKMSDHIHYCPTHEAAFETAAKLDVLTNEYEDLSMEKAELRAALKEIAENHAPLPPRSSWDLSEIARAAIANAEEDTDG